MVRADRPRVSVVVPLYDEADNVADRLCQALGSDLDPRAALGAIWSIVGRANRFAEASAPWRETDPTRRDAALWTLAESVRVIGEALRPFLPETAERILGQLGVEPERDWLAGLAWGQLTGGTETRIPTPVFPRL